MPALDLEQKLAILADAAKYDASCASSGARRRDSLGGKGIGSTTGAGICHAYAPDGRCISLLKVLLTNACLFDCAYCVNRASSNVRRAAFTVEEVVGLTLDFYRRNYIEGLFLSSGIIRSPDHTMGELARVARILRLEHDFRGYIHLKTIPEAGADLVAEAGRWADRLSVNVELPSETSLRRLAPEKRLPAIRRQMGDLRLRIEEGQAARAERTKARPPRFAPAGQSTQVIVGADDARDVDILRMAGGLYAGYRLKRVYYSAFSPIPDASAALPLAAPPLTREHRLYQADWLTRYYGFEVEEIAGATPSGMFDPAIDPKLAWALANRHAFPVDVNRDDRERLLRIPGIGVKAVGRIVSARRHRRLRYDDVARIGGAVRRAAAFFVAADWNPRGLLDAESLAERLRPPPRQLDLFGDAA